MVVGGDSGVILNNEMDDFAIAPGVPNTFGLIGGEANAVAAGKRPLSSMTPVIVRRARAARASSPAARADRSSSAARSRPCSACCDFGLDAGRGRRGPAHPRPVGAGRRRRRAGDSRGDARARSRSAATPCASCRSRAPCRSSRRDRGAFTAAADPRKGGGGATLVSAGGSPSSSRPATARRRSAACSRACSRWTGSSELGPEMIVVDDGSRDRTPLVVADAVRALSAAALPARREPRQGGRAECRHPRHARGDPARFSTTTSSSIGAGWSRSTRTSRRRDVAAAQGTIRLPHRGGREPRRSRPPSSAGRRSRAATSARPRPSRDRLIGANMLDHPRDVRARRPLRRASRTRRRGRVARTPSSRSASAPPAAASGTSRTRSSTTPSSPAGSPPSTFEACTSAAAGAASTTRTRARRSPLGVALRLLPDLGLAAVKIAATALATESAAHRRALARWYHYRAMLAAGRAPRLPGGAPVSTRDGRAAGAAERRELGARRAPAPLLRPRQLAAAVSGVTSPVP